MGGMDITEGMSGRHCWGVGFFFVLSYTGSVVTMEAKLVGIFLSCYLFPLGAVVHLEVGVLHRRPGPSYGIRTIFRRAR